MSPPIPSYPDPDFQARQDAEHLRLLSIFYYVAAGLFAVIGLIPIFHIIMGLAIVGGTLGPGANVSISPGSFPGAPPFPGGSMQPTNNMPSSFGWLFVFMGTFALLLLEGTALLCLLAGCKLARREGKTFIQVVAGLLCLSVPVGTALGVFTFIVLGRPSVAPLFDSQP